MSASGVPSLLNPFDAPQTTTALTGDGAGLQKSSTTPEWGVFLNGVQALNPPPDSVLSFEYKKDWNLPNYRMEEGAFQSYNKVTLPYMIPLRVTKGGSVADRTAFLSAVDALCASLNLYQIVTPERIYLKANPSHYDLMRNSAKGVTLLTVDIWFTEIRNDIVPVFSNVIPASATNNQAVTSNPSPSQPLSVLAQ